MTRHSPLHRTFPVVHLLLVEDNIDDAEFITRLLLNEAEQPFRIRHVKTQAEALLALTEGTYEACILGLFLPDTNGFSALITIHERAPDMPILILTGNQDNTILVQKAVERGAHDYLQKNGLEIYPLERSILHALERKHMEKGVAELSHFDALTGLCNYTMFETRLSMALARAERIGSNVAVILIDLVHFKLLNDLYGYDAGDAAMVAVAERIKSLLRTYDSAARLGSDDFAILFDGDADSRTTADITERVLSAIALPISYGNKKLMLEAKASIALSKKGLTGKALMGQANIALHHAKKGGKHYLFYNPTLSDMTEERSHLEQELRHAIEQREFRLLYQPYWDTETGKILGVEALLRWANPRRGLLCPTEFLAIAESCGFMPDIGALMASTLKQDMQLWQSQHVPPLEIAINLSPTQLDDGRLTQWLMPLLNEHYTVAVEIPETALSSISPARKAVLKMLGDAMPLHLDHYGRNTIALETVCDLKFTALKLDLEIVQGMVDGLAGDALLRGAILLAQHLKLKASAVGVELRWQEKALKELGYNVLQGFLLTPPLPADEIVDWHKPEH